MRTSKSISTVSYNTKEFLLGQLKKLEMNCEVSYWCVIRHDAEDDEKKDHWHVLLHPNKIPDNATLKSFFMEKVPGKEKPLGCLEFRRIYDDDDWILYHEHNPLYLASKCESRAFVYDESDFISSDEDTFKQMYRKAHKSSRWAKNNRVLQELAERNINPIELINRGSCDA